MEKLYSTKRHLFWSVAWMLCCIIFLLVGVAISMAVFCRMTWSHTNGLVISCVQCDIMEKRYKYPGRRLYFERVTNERILYNFEINGQIYSGVYEESLKASENWVRGQRRELISETSKTPVAVWYNPKNPNQNSILKPRLTDLPWWPWLLALISFGGAMQQLQERKNAIRINKELPEAIQKAQVEALKQRLKKMTRK